MKHASKKIVALLMVVAMIISVLPTVFAANVGPFTDVSTSEWFAEYVEYVYDNDLMNGMTATTFEPNGKLTRAQTAMVLYRIAGEEEVEEEASFTDLTYDWYKKCIAWAEAEEIVKGVGDGLFDPDGHITREALVTMMHRYAGLPDAESDELYKDFPDADKVSDWAQDAVNWALGEEIICGSEEVIDGEKTIILNPLGNATRAEFAKIIAQFVRLEGDEECEEHAWDEGKVTKEATCTEAGEMLYTCTVCGETKTEEIPMTAHEYVDGVCKNCGDKLAAVDEIVIYYTNDTHTYVDKDLSFDSVAELKTQTKKVAAGVLLMDAGDHVQGTAYGSLDKGKAIVEMMSAAGYDVATLGNHEFDYGMARALEITKLGVPYVSANFYHEENGVKGESVLDAYKIFTVGGKKIAVVGITTPESFTKSTPKYFQDENGNYIYGIAGGTDGADLYAAVQNAIDAAKAEGVDYVIALGHLGDDPSSQPWTSEEVIANTTGLDAFIDGHSHSTVIGKSVKDKSGKTVLLTQTGEYFDTIGKMTISADGKFSTELLTEFAGKDATVKAIKDKLIADVDEKLGEVIGHADVTLDNYDKDGNRLVRMQETNTGDFAADALFYLFNDTEGLKVDMAIMNGGGVRNKAITGDISYKTCKDIHTFGNVACLIQVTGQQILDALEFGAREVGAEEDGKFKECGGFLQVSNATYEIHTYIKNTIKTDDKGVWTAGPTEYRVKNVMIGGAPLDLTKTYNLAGYNYTLRDLGDGFAMFDGAVNVKDYVMEDYMVLANYVKSFPVVGTLPTIAADNSAYADVNGEGRITVVNAKPDGGDDKPVVSNDFALADGLNDGDEVIIYNAGNSIAVPAVVKGSYYLDSVSITPADGVIKTDDSSIIWTVGKNADGTYTFTNGTNVLSMNTNPGEDGKIKTSVGLDGANPNMKLDVCNAENKSFYIYSANLTGNYGNIYLEWYAQFSDFSAYSTSADRLTEKDFGFQFYVKGAAVTPECTHSNTTVVPAVPATCTAAGKTAGVKCADCGKIISGCEDVAPLGHADANADGKCDNCGKDMSVTPAGDLNVGDTVVFTATVDTGSYEMTGFFSTSAASLGEATAFTGTPTGSFPMTVEAGSESGTYAFKTADGKYLSWTSGNSIDAVDSVNANASWNVTMNADGTATILNATTATSAEMDQRVIIFNLNPTGTTPRFATYSKAPDKVTNTAQYALVTLYIDGATTGCEHTNTEGVTSIPATCTENGMTAGIKCADCGKVISGCETITALGHIDSDGNKKCDRCGFEMGGSFVLAEGIKDGDEVILYNAGSGNALAAVAKGSYYMDYVTIAPAAGAIATEDTTIVWKVSKNADGTYTFSNGTNVLSINLTAEGKTNLSLDGKNPKMTVETLNASNKSYVIYSATQEGGYGKIYLEWYAMFSDFSAYCTSADRVTEEAFGFQFYVKG